MKSRAPISIWNYGPYNPVHVSAGTQPDWFFIHLDGMSRILPPWDIRIGSDNIPATFWAGPVFLPTPYLLAAAYPWIERRFTGDHASHNLLQRPRDVPVRTALGAMAISFYAVLALSGSNDQIAYFFDVSLNATIWAGRMGLLVLPPIAYYVTYRFCIGLQRSDRAVLEHGIETGIVRRLHHGGFIEIHQPLAGVDGNGRPVPLAYQGAPVPKRMNQLGVGGRPRPGSLLTMDPAEQTTALERGRVEEAARNGHGACDAEYRTEQGEAPGSRTSDGRGPSPIGGSGSTAQPDA